MLNKTTICVFAGGNGHYWAVDGEGNINSDSKEPQPFFFQLVGQSKFVIKASNGCFLKGEQNGIVCANVDFAKATHWEF